MGVICGANFGTDARRAGSRTIIPGAGFFISTLPVGIAAVLIGAGVHRRSALYIKKRQGWARGCLGVWVSLRFGSARCRSLLDKGANRKDWFASQWITWFAVPFGGCVFLWRLSCGNCAFDYPIVNFAHPEKIANQSNPLRSKTSLPVAPYPGTDLPALRAEPNRKEPQTPRQSTRPNLGVFDYKADLR